MYVYAIKLLCIVWLESSCLFIVHEPLWTIAVAFVEALSSIKLSLRPLANAHLEQLLQAITAAVEASHLLLAAAC